MNDKNTNSNKSSLLSFVPNLILPPNKTERKKDLVPADFNIKNFIKKGEERKEIKSVNSDFRINKISRLLEKVLDNKIRQVSEVNKCSLLYEMNNKYKRSGEYFYKEDDFFHNFDLNGKNPQSTQDENIEFTFSHQNIKARNNKREIKQDSLNSSKITNYDIENIQIKKVNLNIERDFEDKVSFTKTTRSLMNTPNNKFEIKLKTLLKNELKDTNLNNNPSSLNDRITNLEKNELYNLNLKKEEIIENKIESGNSKNEKTDLEDIMKRINVLKNSRIKDKYNKKEEIFKSELVLNENIKHLKDELVCGIKEANRLNNIKIRITLGNHIMKNSGEKVEKNNKCPNDNENSNNQPSKNPLKFDDLLNKKIQSKIGLEINPKNVIENLSNNEKIVRSTTNFFTINGEEKSYSPYKGVKLHIEKENEKKENFDFSKTDPSSFKMFNIGFAINNAYSKNETQIYQSNKISNKPDNLPDKNIGVENTQFSFTPEINYKTKKREGSSENQNKSNISKASSIDSKRKSITKDSPTILLFKDLVNKKAEVNNKSREEFDSLKKNTPSHMRQFSTENRMPNMNVFDTLEEKKNIILSLKSLREIKKSSPKKADIKEFNINFDELKSILVRNSSDNSNLSPKKYFKDEKIENVRDSSQTFNKLLLSQRRTTRNDAKARSPSEIPLIDFDSNKGTPLKEVEKPINFENEINLLKLRFSEKNCSEQILQRSKSAQIFSSSTNRYNDSEVNSSEKPFNSKDVMNQEEPIIYNNIKSKIFPSISRSKNIKDDIDHADDELKSLSIADHDYFKNNDGKEKSEKKNIDSLTDINSALETKSNINSAVDSKRNSIKKNFFKESYNKTIMNQMTSAASGYISPGLDPIQKKEDEKNSITKIEIQHKDFEEMLDNNENLIKDKINNYTKIRVKGCEEKRDNYFEKYSGRDKIICSSKIKNKDNLSNEHKKPSYNYLNKIDVIWDSNKILNKSKSLIGIENICLFKKFDKNENKPSESNLNMRESPAKNTDEIKNQIKSHKNQKSKLDDLPNFSKIEELIKNKNNSKEKFETIIDNRQDTVIECKNPNSNKISYFDNDEKLLLVSNPSAKASNHYRNSFLTPNFCSNLNLLNEKTTFQLKKLNSEVFNFSKSELNKQILSLWKCNPNSNLNMKYKLENNYLAAKKETETEINMSSFSQIDNHKINFPEENLPEKNPPKINKSNILTNLEKRNFNNNINSFIIEKVKLAREQRSKTSINTAREFDKKDILNKEVNSINNTHLQNKTNNLINDKNRKPISNEKKTTITKTYDNYLIVNDESNLKINFKEKNENFSNTMRNSKNNISKNKQIKSNLYANNYSSKIKKNKQGSKVVVNKRMQSLKSKKDVNSNLGINPAKTSSEVFFSNRKSNNSLDKKNLFNSIKENFSQNKDKISMSNKKNNKKELKIINIENKAKIQYKGSNNLKNPSFKIENGFKKEKQNNKLFSDSPENKKSRLSQNVFKDDFKKNEEGKDKEIDLMKETLLFDHNSIENLNENQKKIIESVLSDRDLLKFLEIKISNSNLANMQIEAESKNNSDINDNLLKGESNITKDKIENFKENISYLFNSYNNELEVPKLEEDKLSESDKKIKERLDENSDGEPYELCNTMSSKDDFGGVSKLSSTKKNDYIIKNVNQNIINNTCDNQRNNNDDTIYCLRESLEDKSKCDNENKKKVNKEKNNPNHDRVSKSFYKENKTEYFKNFQKSDRNDKSIESNSIRKNSIFDNIKTITINKTLYLENIQKNMIFNIHKDLNNKDQDEEGEEKYIFRKSAKNSLSKSKTCTIFKISPIRKENDSDNYNIIRNNFNKTFVIDIKDNKKKFKTISTLDKSKISITEKRKTRIQPRVKSYSNIKKPLKNFNFKDKKINCKPIINNKTSRDNQIKIENQTNVIPFDLVNIYKNERINNLRKDLNSNGQQRKSDHYLESKEADQTLINNNNEMVHKVNNNSNKNIESAIDLINEELKKLAISPQDKSITSNVYKFINNENSNFNNKSTPKKFAPEILIKEENKYSFKSDSLMKTPNLNSNQKLDLNQFLNQTKSPKCNEDYLDIEIDSPNFLRNFSSKNGFENSNKTELMEMSNINSDNFNSLNAENEKDFILNSSENQNKNIDGNQNNQEENTEISDTNIALKKFDNQKFYNSARNFNKNNTKASEKINNNDLLKSEKKKKSSIIDILTQEARDKAIIKVESEKIISENQDVDDSLNQFIRERKGNISNRIGIINNYNNFFFAEYHTYTGRKKNIKTFK